MAGKNDRRNKCVQIRDKMIKFLLTKQYDGETVHDYYNRFENNCDTLDVIGGENIYASRK